MRRGREETVIGRVPAVHVRVPYAGEDGEVLTMPGEMFQIGRGLVRGTGGVRGWEEFFRQQAEVVANTEKTPRGSIDSGARMGRQHGFEQRQSERNTRSAKKMTAVHR